MRRDAPDVGFDGLQVGMARMGPEQAPERVGRLADPEFEWIADMLSRHAFILQNRVLGTAAGCATPDLWTGADAHGHDPYEPSA
jgi:hypothetical protein